MRFAELLGRGTHPRDRESGPPQLQGHRAPALGDLSTPYHMHLFTWLFIRFLYHTLHNKQVSVNNHCPELCEPLQQLLKTMTGLWSEGDNLGLETGI